MLHFFQVGDEQGMDVAMRALVNMQYERTHLDLFHGAFRARGDVLEVLPAYEEEGIRVEYFGDEIERVARFDVLRGEVLQDIDKIAVYPRSHYVTPEEAMRRAIGTIEEELRERLQDLESQDKLLERQRLEQRTMFDLEMLTEMGFCHGIENYSRHLTGLPPGHPPPTLIDYFPDDFLLVVDESHQTVPQVRAMFNGDRARKQTLWTTASVYRRPSTTAPLPSRSGNRRRGRESSCRRLQVRGSCSALRASSPNRSSGPPVS